MSPALVIGAGGLIGGALLRQLRQRACLAVATTRGAPIADTLTFDLSDPPSTLLEAPSVRRLAVSGSWISFLVAGVTGYDRCAEDPVGTRRINVTKSVLLAGKLTQAGAFVVYPSSTAVFGDAMGPFDEWSPLCATSEYGRQKADAERGMLGLPSGSHGRPEVAIVRLTKVLDNRGRVGQWTETLKAGDPIEAATDVWLSPISLDFAVKALIEVGVAGRGGMYHLSGEGVTTYFELAMRLADAIGAQRSQVRPVEVGQLGGPGQRSVGLRMSETTRQTTLRPQPMDALLSDLLTAS